LSDAAGRRTRPPVHAPRQSVGDPRDAPPVARGRRTGLALLAAAGRGRLLRQQPAPGSHLPHRRLGPRLDDGRLQRWRHLEHETGRRPPGPGPENAVAVGVHGCSSAANSVTSPRRPGAHLSPRACAGPYPPRQEPPRTTPAGDGTRSCPAEYPGDDHGFIGQLCERERGHDVEHEHLAVIEGTRYTRRLTWN